MILQASLFTSSLEFSNQTRTQNEKASPSPRGEGRSTTLRAPTTLQASPSTSSLASSNQIQTQNDKRQSWSQVKSRQGGGALLSRGVLRSCRPHRTLPAWGPPIKLRLGMRKGRAEMLLDQPLTVVEISRLKKKKFLYCDLDHISYWRKANAAQTIGPQELNPHFKKESLANEHCLDRPQH